MWSISLSLCFVIVVIFTAPFYITTMPDPNKVTALVEWLGVTVLGGVIGYLVSILIGRSKS